MSAHFQSFRVFVKGVLFASALLLSAGSSGIAGGVRIINYGHSSLLIKGGGQSVLLNPFKAVGCASGLKEPRLSANVILASSQLADEGARVANGIFLVEPGSYRVGGVTFEGFSVPHDRLGGRRFGLATIWKWKQGGLSFAHLGGGAAPLSGVNKVLLGQPDVLIIAVGGGAKAYNGIEAARIVKELNPKSVIPVKYVRAKSIKGCDQTGIQPFLDAMEGTQTRRVGKSFFLKSKPYSSTIVNIMQ